MSLDDVTMNEHPEAFKHPEAIKSIKHSDASSMYNNLLIQGSITLVKEIIFNSTDEKDILRACLRTEVAPGISVLDAEEWLRILGSKILETATADPRRSI